MATGFLRNSRLEEERKRAEAAEARFQSERERVDRYMEELIRLSERYLTAMENMARRLRDMDTRNGETRQTDE